MILTSVKFISIQTEVSASFPHRSHHIVEERCREYAINHIWITTELFGFRPTGSKGLPLFPPLWYFHPVLFTEASFWLPSLTLNFSWPIKLLCVLIPSTCEQYQFKLRNVLTEPRLSYFFKWRILHQWAKTSQGSLDSFSRCIQRF